MNRLFTPLVERRTYVETADLVLDLVVGTLWFSVFTTLVATGGSLLFTLIGLPILTGTFYLARVAAMLERRRARAFLATEIEEPRRAPAHGSGSFEKLIVPFRDRTTWKELFYVSLVQPIQSVANFTVAVTVWALPVWAITLPLYATHTRPKLWTGRRLDTWHEILPLAIVGLAALLLAPWIIRAVAAADRAVARWGLTMSPPALRDDRVDTLLPTHVPS
jgi:putative sensor protein